MMKRSIFLSVVVLSHVGQIANADLSLNGAVLHRQPLDATIDGWISDCTFGTAINEFVLLGLDGPYGGLTDYSKVLKNGIITGVTWYGYYGNGSFTPTIGDTVDFSLAFSWNYGDDDPGGSLVHQVVAATVSGSVAAAGRTIYEFVTDSFPPVSIADVYSTYGEYAIWLSISECDARSYLIGDSWLWSRSRSGSDGGPLYEGGSRSYYDGDMAFTLTGVVPLPSAVLLGVLGLGVVGVKLRKHA